MFGNSHINDSIAKHLCEITYSSQQAIGDTWRATAQPGFSETRRSMKKYMIKGFISLFGSSDKYEQIFDELRLTGKIADSRRPYTVLKFFVRCPGKRRSLQVGICHKVKVT